MHHDVHILIFEHINMYVHMCAHALFEMFLTHLHAILTCRPLSWKASTGKGKVTLLLPSTENGVSIERKM